MNLAPRIVDLAAQFAGDPDGRRREEWRSDLAAADEVGVARSTIVVGALRAAIALRGDAARMLPDRARGIRRLRWAATALAVAAILAAGAFFVAGSSSPGVRGLGLAALVAAAIAAVPGLAGTAIAVPLIIGAQTRSVRFTLLAGMLIGGPLAFGGVLVSSFGLVFLGGLLLGWVVAVVAMSLPTAADPAVRATWPGIPARLGLRPTALLSATAVVVTTAVGALHVLVWNPQAKVTGLGIGEIYATMAARGESPAGAIAAVTVWASGWVALAILFLLVALIGRRGILARLDARRIARTALVAVAGVGFSVWVAGFSMGMSVADAFATTGGDAAQTGVLLAAAAVVAGLAAAMRVIPPRPPLVPAATMGAAQP